MTIGEKIKKYRLDYNLSQKELAKQSGMSEPTLRNYELGNRTPSDDQLKKISKALDISIYELKNPNFDNVEGIMHALFYLENYCGLTINTKEQSFTFDSSNKSGKSINKHLNKWCKIKKELEDKRISKSEYEIWKKKFKKKE